MFKKGQIYRIKKYWGSLADTNTLIMIFDDLPSCFTQHHHLCKYQHMKNAMFPCVPMLWLKDSMLTCVHWGIRQEYIDEHLELLTNE